MTDTYNMSSHRSIGFSAIPRRLSNWIAGSILFRGKIFPHTLLVLLQVTCNLVLQKTRKEMESQIRKQKLRQISSAASLPNLSKVSVFRFYISCKFSE